MKSRFIWGICLVILLALAACAPVPPTLPAAPSAEETPILITVPTVTPTLVPVTLNVFAAASLTNSFDEIGKAFEAAHPGVTVTFNFSGSQALATQINNGAPVDVFASANITQMSLVAKAGRIDAIAPKTFARNRLLVIYPKANPAKIQTLQDLAKPGVKLILADKSVPAGQYALNFLDNAAQDGSFGPAYKDDVLKNVVSYELDVKSVLAKVELGEADAGIVYTTDAVTDTKGQTGQLAIPDHLNVIATYPIAVVKDSIHMALAQAFVDYVLSPEGQATLTKFGFIPGQ